jgi:hypothetical protein
MLYAEDPISVGGFLPLHSISYGLPADRDLSGPEMETVDGEAEIINKNFK